MRMQNLSIWVECYVKEGAVINAYLISVYAEVITVQELYHNCLQCILPSTGSKTLLRNFYGSHAAGCPPRTTSTSFLWKTEGSMLRENAATSCSDFVPFTQSKVPS